MAGSQLIIGRYDVAGARREYLFYVYAGALGVQRASAPSYPTVTGPATLTNGVWYHGLATYDGTNGCLYVNGSLVATGSLNVFVNNDPYRDSRIGAWVHSSIGFQGWINDMRLYNVAKTSNQVFKIFGGNR
jgi:hypothetical protein